MNHFQKERFQILHSTSTCINDSQLAEKEQSTFLTCPCHEIYREEAVGLKSYNYTFKIAIFVNMWNLGHVLENLIVCQWLLN